MAKRASRRRAAICFGALTPVALRAPSVSASPSRWGQQCSLGAAAAAHAVEVSFSPLRDGDSIVEVGDVGLAAAAFSEVSVPFAMGTAL